MKKISAETLIEVPFYDLDPMNVVWHGNYIKYLKPQDVICFPKSDIIMTI
ncbi:MAG: hypothetical protein ACLSA2_00440 [Candidatus Gastranaerophilaceae bacterium]